METEQHHLGEQQLTHERKHHAEKRKQYAKRRRSTMLRRRSSSMQRRQSNMLGEEVAAYRAEKGTEAAVCRGDKAAR